MLGLKILKFFYFVFYFQFCRQNKLFFRLHYPSGVESMRLALVGARDHNSLPNIDLLLPNEPIMAKVSRDQLLVVIIYPQPSYNQPPTSKNGYNQPPNLNKSQADTFLKAISPGLNGKGYNLMVDEC